VTWGWGAVMLSTVERGTILECCNRKARKAEGLHHYLFGPPRCTVCARAFHDGIDHRPEPLGHEEGR